MSLINDAWSVSSIISEEFEKLDKDDLLLSDNERLRGRVEELEKVVVMQRNEIMLLQASMADILRRVQNLESKPGQYNSLPRPSRLTSSQSTYGMPNPMSKSMHSGESASPHRRRQSFMNVPVGKSARGSPMRKWVSAGASSPAEALPKTPPDPRSRRISTTTTTSSSEEPCTSGTMTPIVNRVRRISVSNSHMSSSQLSLSSTVTRKNPHSCRPANGSLPIFVAGKTVNIQMPSEFKDFDPTQLQDPPNIRPTLKHVYSFRGKDVRSNIEILPTGEFLFFSANFVIMMSREGDQRIYHGHTSDVKCLALHPNKIIVASGQSTCHSSEKSLRTEHSSPVETPDELVKQFEKDHTEAHIRIWDSVKLQTILIIGGLDVSFDKGVGQLAFSIFDAGQHLAVCDDSLKHTLTIWRWQKSRKIGEVKAANDQVFDMRWHPQIRNLIVLFGKSHFSLFHLDPTTGLLTKTSPIFEGRDKPKTVLSMCFGKEGQIITGDSNGTITIWDPKTLRILKQAFSVHPGGIYSLCVSRSGKLLSGGKDRMISEWEIDSLVRSRRPVELPDDRGFARTIIEVSADCLLVGTSTNSLLIGNTDLASLIEGDPGETTALISCATTHFLTGSKCGVLRKWSIAERKIEWTKKYMGSIECLDVDASATHVIIGFLSGGWQIVNMVNQETIEDRRDGSSPIVCVKFAPAGGTFAVTNKDPSCLIYRLDASRNLISLAKIHQLPSPIIHLDWSTDGQTIRAQTIAYHLFYWTRNGEQLSQRSGDEWASATCSIAFETCLVEHSSNGQVGSTSKIDDVSAVGMENGTIRLYSSPVLSLNAGFIELVGHPKSVKAVKFASKTSLLTMSPVDNSIFEWDILYNN